MQKYALPFSRRKFLKQTAGAAILTPGIINSELAHAQGSNLEYQPLAPELKVPYWIDGNGDEMKPVTLAQHTNKWVFLKCFQNWCPGCHASGFPALQKIVKTFGTSHEKIAFAAIQTTFEGHYTNNKAALRPLQLRYKSPIPFGHDAGDPDLPNDNPAHYPNTMRDFSTRGTPWIIVISPSGHVAYGNFHINIDALIDYLKEDFAKA